jgi:hypothetical protein
MANVAVSDRDPRSRPAECKQVPLDLIEAERSTQARMRLNPSRVAELAELLKRGVRFKDPLEVYFDGTRYWLGDGFHRVAAYRKAGRAKVEANVREGDHDDAMVHACGANAEHGQPRSREDVRRACLLLLKNDRYRKYSDNTLAKIVRTDNKTVARVREQTGQPPGTTYVDRWGNETEMDTSNLIGRRPKGAAAFADLAPQFHGAVRKLLKEMSLQIESTNRFLLAFLGQLPAKPEKLAELLAEITEGQADAR